MSDNVHDCAGVEIDGVLFVRLDDVRPMRDEITALDAERDRLCAALAAETERCAKVVDAVVPMLDRMAATYPGDPTGTIAAEIDIRTRIAAAIRASAPSPAPEPDAAKVERVARALCKADGYDPDRIVAPKNGADKGDSRPYWRLFERRAVTAVAALTAQEQT